MLNTIIHFLIRRLIWVDAKPQKVMSSTLDGDDVKTLLDLAPTTGRSVVFGLALHSSQLYVSVWNAGKVDALSTNLITFPRRMVPKIV